MPRPRLPQFTCHMRAVMPLSIAQHCRTCWWTTLDFLDLAHLDQILGSGHGFQATDRKLQHEPEHSMMQLLSSMLHRIK